ncbi:MAG: bacteriohemerythrin [Ignavibacteriales bacterium]|nr:MAG: bacteriohemerythrin [Ignavibacteriales bacterium]
MALITWSEKYSVNIQSIDTQHKKLAELVNQLHSALAEGKAKEVLSKILSELVSYTKTHFAYEEKLLQQEKFPGYLAHKMEHDSLTQKVLSFQKEFQAGKSAFSVELMNFLKDWLINHIVGSDKKYTQHLKSKNIV